MGIVYTMFNFSFFHKGNIKLFSNTYSYNVEKLELLGEGHYSQVYSYKITYFKGEKTWRVIYLAGKHFKGDISEYESKISYLKKIKQITYTTRKFSSTTTKVNCQNFNLQDLENIIFLTDFT
jgi:hypothetical protein